MRFGDLINGTLKGAHGSYAQVRLTRTRVQEWELLSFERLAGSDGISGMEVDKCMRFACVRSLCLALKNVNCDVQRWEGTCV